MTRSSSFQSVNQSRFLIIGYGNELRGDDAVGPRVAEIVANWHLPSIKTISVHQLTPELVNDIALTDYVIFVDACSDSRCARTVQLDPIVVGNHSTRTLAAQDTHTYNPLTLLNLAQQLYERKPQAWFLQVPIESVEFGKELSSTTKRGCDQAVRTIEQFLRTYQKPTQMEQALCMKSA
ncbi:MAG: hydrogenase maturation protease [Cyanobacteria bacterium J06555_13]